MANHFHLDSTYEILKEESSTYTWWVEQVKQARLGKTFITSKGISSIP